MKVNKTKEAILSHKELLSLLLYNPDTGAFTWRSSGSGRSINSIAGAKINGYLKITINGEFYLSHRLAFFYQNRSWPKNEIDHINHIRDDNRIENLKETTRRGNSINRAINKNSTSGFTGVSLHRNGKWRSSIKINDATKHLGYFKKLSNAVRARIDAEKEYGFHVNHGSNKAIEGRVS